MAPKCWVTELIKKILDDHVDEYFGSKKRGAKKEVGSKVEELILALDGIEEIESLNNKIQTWFGNAGKKGGGGGGRGDNDNSDDDVAPKWRTTWNLRSVVAHVYSEELAAELRKHPNIRGYQSLLTDKVNTLTASEKKRLEQKAVIWTKQGVDQAYQQRMVQKELPQTAADFIDEVDRKYGAVVVMMVAYVDEVGDVKKTRFETNSRKPTGKKFTVQSGKFQEGIFKEFGEWAAKELGEDLDEEEGNIPPKLKGRGGVCRKLEMTAEGEIILPERTDWPVAVLLEVIRTVMTMAYCDAMGKPKARVPWGVLAKDPDCYIERKYYPKDFEFVEPSKLNGDPAMRVGR
ncbi:hypothetical protein JAAARDRAFT_201357 [Jaapia argillacea MUCL 33604]|uniref:Uncharacterized protein n=1 Tax=Jaapia argillacea MUCL 33604 TaxID=933084 RepID=A0A067P2A1_9AGAM|nr:hypothetical protein JAAARDRAFT_201357 [Jaapia argillacea MUCL 33604]